MLIALLLAVLVDGDEHDADATTPRSLKRGSIRVDVQRPIVEILHISILGASVASRNPRESASLANVPAGHDRDNDVDVAYEGDAYWQKFKAEGTWAAPLDGYPS